MAITKTFDELEPGKLYCRVLDVDSREYKYAELKGDVVAMLDNSAIELRVTRDKGFLEVRSNGRLNTQLTLMPRVANEVWVR